MTESISRVHGLFVLNEGGACLYNRKFTDYLKNINVDLITPFFSAILSFSNSVLSKKLEVLELSDLRFVFKKEKNFIFVLLSDSKQNYLFLNSRLEMIVKVFFESFGDDVKNGECGVIEDDVFDKLIDRITSGGDEISKIKEHGSYTKIVNYFSNLISQGEIVGAALLTTKGNTIYSSLSEDILLRAMRELEIRYMTGSFDMPQLFYTLGNGQKVCERNFSYANQMELVVIIQFAPATQFGMMDYSAENIIEKLQSLM